MLPGALFLCLYEAYEAAHLPPSTRRVQKNRYPGLDKGGRGGVSGLVSAFAAPPSGGFF